MTIEEWIISVATSIVSGIIVFLITRTAYSNKKRMSENNLASPIRKSTVVFATVIATLLGFIAIYFLFKYSTVVTAQTPNNNVIASQNAENSYTETLVSPTNTMVAIATESMQPVKDDPVRQPLVVRITDPQEGAYVPLSYSVSGEISGDIPEDVYLWVFINPAGSSSWWPEGSTLTPWQGQWSTNVAIGGSNSSGETFYIYVVSVNAEDDQYLRDYQANGQSTGDYPIIPLPDSAELLTRVSCIRE